MSNISGKHFIFLFIYLLDLVSTFHPLHKIGFPCTCLLYYTTNIKNKKKTKTTKKKLHNFCHMETKNSGSIASPMTMLKAFSMETNRAEFSLFTHRKKFP